MQICLPPVRPIVIWSNSHHDDILQAAGTNMSVREKVFGTGNKMLKQPILENECNHSSIKVK